ncbi:MAG TPA: hypothetical protein VIG45_07935 [Erysipelothrix sp.]
MKQYWKSLFTIIISSLLYGVVERFLPGFLTWFLEILWIAILLFIGHSFSIKSKRNNRWFGKTIITIVVLFIAGLRMGWFIMPQFNQALSFLGLTGTFLDIILIFCGWAFFQV